mgnify:FL=1|tara:strand:- start:39 stop:1406 length:1368 start_codon:yes stop_codon:yes gene_type:complete
MAGKKISELASLGTSFAATDLFEISKDTGGGTYASRKITGAEMITSIGAGTVTSVTFDPGETGFSVTGSPITTSGTIELSGTLAIANGGTGASTAQAAIDALTGAASATIGHVLTVDASNNAVFAAAGGGGASDLDGLADVEVVAAGGTAAQYSIFLSNGSTAGGAPQHGTLSTAIANIAIGPSALSNITQGDYNVALGYKSLEDIVSGGFNTGMGYSSLANTTGSGNTAVGYNAGGTNTSGSYNTYIGGDMGGVNTGQYQIGIGWGVFAGGSNTFALGKTSKTLLHGEYGTAGQTKLGINLGNTYVTPSATLHVKGAGATSATTSLLVENSSGTDIIKATDDGVVEFNGQAYSPTQTLSDGANIAVDFNDGNVATVTLAGNRTLDNPSNPKDGGTYIVIVKQDGTGSRTLAYGGNYKWEGGTAPTLSTGANAVDILTFVSDGTNMYGVAAQNFS